MLLSSRVWFARLLLVVVVVVSISILVKGFVLDPNNKATRTVSSSSRLPVPALLQLAVTPPPSSSSDDEEDKNKQLSKLG